MNIVCIIQARLGSTRLPGKVLKKINNTSVIDIVNLRLKKCRNKFKIVYAIPDNDSNLPLERYLIDKKLDYYKGSEYDVLSRYFYCAQSYKADLIIRITCDCPLIDYLTVDEIIESYTNSDCDYIVKENMPIGTTAEAFTFNSLQNAFNNSDKSYEREHVIPYFIDHPELFNNRFLQHTSEVDLSKLRLTLDTQQDYDLIQNIFSKFSFDVSLDTVISYLSLNPNLIKINAHVKQKTYTEFQKEI